MKLRQRPAPKVRIEIIPMIDVIFFLLVFFMVTSLAMTRINSVKVSLPKTSDKPQPINQNVILTIRKDGSLLVNKTPVTMGTLGQRLVYEMQSSPQATVIVNADENDGYGLVVQAMQKAKDAGIRKFALAAEADRGK